MRAGSNLRPLTWTLGRTPRQDAPPTEFFPAHVPGAVQLDWGRARGLPDYWVADHHELYQGLEDWFWVYRATLEVPQLRPDERLFFVCGGVDYRCRVSLAGRVVHEQEGMFTPFAVELAAPPESPRARQVGRGVPMQTGDVIELMVFPAPKAPGEPEGRAEARFSVKPAVSYGWDFHPRLIPLGIWQETGLEVRPRVYVQSVDVRYRLNDDFSRADVSVAVTLSDDEGSAERDVNSLNPAVKHAGRSSFGVVDPALKHASRPSLGVVDIAAVDHANRPTFRLIDPSGRSVVDCAEPHFAVIPPRLWWPAGEGEAALYTLEIYLDGILAWTQKLGFRRVRLVMPEGAWREPAHFPKSRSDPPITLEVNGRIVFARGSNWVCPEIFPGIISAETYRPLLELAHAAHFNLLRCWGGAIVNKESFYEQCDALGLMVWTEFPLACNLYEGGEDYLRVLERESRSIIARVRQHPSHVLWCGGNELFNAWSGMTDQSLPLRLLNKNCYELDRDTPFIATAPLGGMAHGDYRFRDERGREPFQIFSEARATAYTEFGCPGPSLIDCLKSFMPAAELFPPRFGSAWETHHGLGAWEMDPGTWLCQDAIEHYFGPPRALDQLVECGQLLQSQGYKFIFEEARRQKPKCAMALNWCFNEPWPSAANNNLINWPARPKPAYFAVQASCRPVLASARVPKFAWASGEIFRAELWLLNDSPEPTPAGTLSAELLFGEVRIALGRVDFPALAPRKNFAGLSLQAELPDFPEKTFTLAVGVIDRPHLASEYVFVQT